MFANNKEFNQPLNNWDTRTVTTMEGVFDHALAFN
jgi:surface protein